MFYDSIYFYVIIYFYGNKNNDLFVMIYQSHPYTNSAFSPYHENHLSSQNIL
jgi:hypothetical protein